MSFKEKISQFFERKADQAVERIDHTPTNKLILTVLVIFSVGTVVVGTIQVKAFLDKPFFADRLIEDKGKIRGPLDLLDYIREQQKTNAAIEAMKQRDTDGDGLSDYDETYVYHTNPYTKYTYAGGKTDKEIVDSGEWSQACPGGTCPANNANDTPPSTTDLNSIIPANIQIPIPTDNNATNSAPSSSNTNANVNASSDLSSQLLGTNGQLSQLTTDQKSELRTYFQNMKPSDLRQMLLQQGFAQDKIDALSDQDLQQTLTSLLETLK